MTHRSSCSWSCFLAAAIALACLAPGDAAVELWWVKEKVLYNEAVYQCKVNNGILARYEVTPKALTDLSARYGTHGTACADPYLIPTCIYIYSF